MNKPPAQTIFTWLRNNLDRHYLGALTHHDARALQASVQVAELWIHGDPGHRPMSALAYNQVVRQMQEDTQWLAYHAIAHVADWCHRDQLWREASLPRSRLAGRPECKFGPGSRATPLAPPAAPPSTALPLE